MNNKLSYICNKNNCIKYNRNQTYINVLKNILNKIINEAVNVNQNFHVPLRLKRKYKVNYVVPFKGRDNASGAIYIKDV